MADSDNKKLGVIALAALISGALGSIYALWMIYAAGIQYLFMTFVFLALGIPVFIWARWDDRKALKSAGANGTAGADTDKFFTKPELIAAILIALVGIVAIVEFALGKVDF